MLVCWKNDSFIKGKSQNILYQNVRVWLRLARNHCHLCMKGSVAQTLNVAFWKSISFFFHQRFIFADEINRNEMWVRGKSGKNAGEKPKDTYTIFETII